MLALVPIVETLLKFDLKKKSHTDPFLPNMEESALHYYFWTRVHERATQVELLTNENDFLSSRLISSINEC